MNKQALRILKITSLIFTLVFVYKKDSNAVYQVMGAGQQKCSVILMHSEVKEAKYIIVSWTQGFLSGLNLGVSVLNRTLTNTISDDKLWEKILKNCNRNPNLNLTTISQSIFTELNQSESIEDSSISAN